jgi:hypothetical protein
VLGSQILGAIFDREERGSVRHLTGFILAVITAAALFFGACWGVTRIIALHATTAGPHAGHPLASLHGLLAIGAVIGAGLLIGVVAIAPRISPLASGLPGLVMLGWSALWVAGSRYTLRYLPFPGSQQASGLTFLLEHGILAMLGGLMVVALLVPSRWRRIEDYEEDDEDLDVPAALGLVP